MCLHKSCFLTVIYSNSLCIITDDYNSTYISSHSIQLIMMLIFLFWDTQVDKTYKILMFVEFTLHHERQITNINTGKITACNTRTNAVKSRKLHTPDKEFRGKGCCFSLVLGGKS